MTTLRIPRDYSTLKDKELVEKLVERPIDENLHEYFVSKRCYDILTYISRTFYHSDDSKALLGEFYEFLSDKDWAVLRNWKNKNGATLHSYISQCTINYFIKKNKIEKKRAEKEFVPQTQEILDRINNTILEEEPEELPVRKAYEMLNERDREILRLLIIEEKSTLDAAQYIWKYINSEATLDEVPAKRIQGTISMAKYRAQFTLLENLKSLC